MSKLPKRSFLDASRYRDEAEAIAAERRRVDPKRKEGIKWYEVLQDILDTHLKGWK